MGLVKMKNMSFAMTTEQVRNQSKTVTRRFGWWFLKTGDVVQPVLKRRGYEKVSKENALAFICSGWVI
jgi:hypothetical protein